MSKIELKPKCENCTKRFEKDCGHRLTDSSGTKFLIPDMCACDGMNQCMFFDPDPDCQLLQVTLTESKAKKIQKDLNKMLEELNSLQEELQKMIDDMGLWL